jgi:predicted nucleotidyltransferase
MPIASEITLEERRRYIEAFKNRPTLPEPSQEEETEYRQSLSLVREAANVLKERFGVKHVILIGSLAHGAWFTQKSDIDLIADGLKGDKYWQAWKLLEKLIPGRTIDLIEMETAGESLKRAISRYGMEL